MDVASRNHYRSPLGLPFLEEKHGATIGKLVVFAPGVLTIGVFAGRAQIMNQLDFKMAQPFKVGHTTHRLGLTLIRPVQGTDQMVIEISAASGSPSVKWWM